MNHLPEILGIEVPLLCKEVALIYSGQYIFLLFNTGPTIQTTCKAGRPAAAQTAAALSSSASAHGALAIAVIGRTASAALIGHSHLHGGRAAVSPGSPIAALLAVIVAPLLRGASPVPLAVTHLALLRLVPAQLLRQRKHLRAATKPSCRHCKTVALLVALMVEFSTLLKDKSNFMLFGKRGSDEFTGAHWPQRLLRRSTDDWPGAE